MMDREETKKAIVVMQGFIEGKQIQVSYSEVWRDVCVEPEFDFRHREYRIKPEPREVWIAFNSNGSIFGSSSNSNKPDWHTAPIKFREVTDG